MHIWHWLYLITIFTHCKAKKYSVENASGFGLRFVGISSVDGNQVRFPIIESSPGFTISMWIRRICPGRDKMSISQDSCGFPNAVFAYTSIESPLGRPPLKKADELSSLDDWELSTPAIQLLDYDDGLIEVAGVIISSGFTSPLTSRKNPWNWQHFIFSFNASDSHFIIARNLGVDGTEVLIDSLLEEQEYEYVSEAQSELMQKMFENGKLPEGHLVFGSANVNDDSFSGEIDNLCYWNSYIRPDELSKIATKGCEQVVPDHLIGDYRFDTVNNETSMLYNSKTGEFDAIHRNIVKINNEEYLLDGTGDGTPIYFASDLPTTENVATKVVHRFMGDTSTSFQIRFVSTDGFSTVFVNLTGGSVQNEMGTITSTKGDSFEIDPIQIDPMSPDVVAIELNFTFVATDAGMDGIGEFELTIQLDNETHFVKVSIATLKDDHLPDRVIKVTENDDSYLHLPWTSIDFIQEFGVPMHDIQVYIHQVYLHGLNYSDPQYISPVQPIGSILISSADENKSDDCITGSVLMYHCPLCEEDGINLSVKGEVLDLSTLVDGPILLSDALRRLQIVHKSVGGTCLQDGRIDIEYQVKSGIYWTNKATVTLLFKRENLPPSVQDINVVTAEDKVAKFSLGPLIYDREDKNLLVFVSKLPQHGTLYMTTPENETMEINFEGDSGPKGQWVSAIEQPILDSNGRSWYDEFSSIRASSCYSTDWCLNGLSGPPDVYPVNEDLIGTWQPSFDAINSDPEWIELEYKDFVYARELQIFENWHPGAATHIFLKNVHTNEWVAAWTGKDTTMQLCPNSKEKCAAATSYKLMPLPFSTRFVRIQFVEMAANRWWSIDAVRLVGLKSQTHNILPTNLILSYKPDLNFVGRDEFELAAFDPTYFRLTLASYLDPPESRISGTVKLNILPMNDVPLLNASNSQQMLIKVPESEFSIVEIDGDTMMQTVIAINVFERDVGDHVMLEYVSADPKLLLRFGNGLLEVTEGFLFSPVARTENMFQFSMVIALKEEQCEPIEGKIFDIHLNGIDLLESVPMLIQLQMVCAPVHHRIVFPVYANWAKQTCYTVGGIGIILSVGAMAFNVLYRSFVAVRISSWRINLLILVGTVLIFAHIILAGRNSMDLEACENALLFFHEHVESSYHVNVTDDCKNIAGAKLCRTPTALLCVGFVFIFRSMYRKLTKIHHIFNNRSMKIIVYPDRLIISRVLMEAVVAIICIFVWDAYFPFTMQFGVGGSRYDPTSNSFIHNGIASCHSRTTDIFSLVAAFFLILMLAFGAYMAYLVRRVRTFARHNDAKYVALCIYTMALLLVPYSAMLQLTSSTESINIRLFVDIAIKAICSFVIIVMITAPQMYHCYATTHSNQMFPKTAANDPASNFGQVTSQDTVRRIEEFIRQKGLEAEYHRKFGMKHQVTSVFSSGAV